MDQQSLSDICTRSQLYRDVDGELLNFDEEYYEFANVNDMIQLFNQYMSNYSDSSLLPSSSISPIATTTTTALTNDFTNYSSIFLPNENLDSLENSSLMTRERVQMLTNLQEFLHNLDPRNDIDLYNEIVFQNALIVSAYVLIIVVSLFGNLLVLFVILSHRHLRAQTTNKLIANLTVSDLLLTTFNIPLTVVRLLLDSWPLGSAFCHLGPLVQAMSVYVSTLTMVVIALDRYHVLLGVLPKRLTSTLPSIWTNVLIWLFAAIFSIPHFIFTRVVHKQTYTCVKRCQAIYPKPAVTYSKAITIFTFLSQYLVPLTIIVICYTQIGLHIWRRVHIGAMTDTQKINHLQARKRTIKMLILVVIVFAICWLPLNLYHLYLDFVPNSFYSKPTFILCHWFGISSVCYNPFIYFWLNKQYKKRARKIFRMCFKCRYSSGRNERKSSHSIVGNNQTTICVSCNEEDNNKFVSSCRHLSGHRLMVLSKNRNNNNKRSNSNGQQQHQNGSSNRKISTNTAKSN